MADIIYLTEEGYNNLKKELEQLRSVERPAISAQIAEARDKGDLSENAEYDAAKEAQGMLEMRIAKMEAMFSAARIVNQSQMKIDTVRILNKVHLMNLSINKEVTFTLVSEKEASVKDGRLAIGTPIAQALLGKKVGDVVDVTVPSGAKMSFKILEIGI
ncbi:MAG: transcription elongation factor GreA [Rikenellaceae bacterium]